MSMLTRRDALTALTATSVVASSLFPSLLAPLVGCGAGKGEPKSGAGGGADGDSGGSSVDTSGGGEGSGGDSAEPAVELCQGESTALPETCPSPTSADGEGPNYRTGAPERADLNVQGIVGLTLWVSGKVLTPDCVPVVGAEIDIWQAGPDGKYDNESDELLWRGRIFTDSDGGYCFSTIMPPAILNDPAANYYNVPHIHFKIRLDGEELLCTQLVFPEEADIGDGTMEDKPDDRELSAEHLDESTARVVFNFILGAPPIEEPAAAP